MPTTPQPSDDRKLFAGVLRGYRHFAVRDEAEFFGDWAEGSQPDYRVRSPAYDYTWQDGENVALCTRYSQYSGIDLHRIDERIAILEQALSAVDRRVRGRIEPLDLVSVHHGPRPLERWRAELCELICVRAEVVRFKKGEHTLKGCTCGFYVSYKPSSDFYETATETHVHAVVEAYGRIVLGTKGFRSQKLRIVAMAPWVRKMQAPQYPHRALALKAQWAAEGPPPSIEAQAWAVRRQFPSVRWFDNWKEMRTAYPEPDRSGLVRDVEKPYGA